MRPISEQALGEKDWRVVRTKIIRRSYFLFLEKALPSKGMLV